MEEMCIGEIKARILETEHEMIQQGYMNWESLDNYQSSVELLAYISGINEMAQALIDEMCGDEDG